MKLVRVGYGVAVALWLACLVLPAAEIDGSLRLSGYRVFLIGIDALGEGILGWLANPLALAAVLAGLFGLTLTATALAASACVLALSSLSAPESARASGAPITEVGFDVGFFLWLAACSLIFATSVYALLRSRRTAAGA